MYQGEWLSVYWKVKVNSMGCIRSDMILFAEATRVLNLVFLLPRAPAAWNCYDFFLLSASSFEPPSEREREREREDKEDSERKGQQVNPGVVVLRHGTPPPSLFIPCFPRELPPVVSQKAQYNNRLRVLCWYPCLCFMTPHISLFGYSVTLSLPFF
jgi:hypothetical protein